MKIYLFILVLSTSVFKMASQNSSEWNWLKSVNDPPKGVPAYYKDNQKTTSKEMGPLNGNGTLGFTYSVSGCGVGYATASKKLAQRFANQPCATNGPAQPATFTISGIPAGAVIVKAYVWCDISGSGPAITLTVKNPAMATTNYAMSLIGSIGDKCAGYAGSYSYRADVTSSIIGNGTYTLSGMPVDPLSSFTNDTDGATMMVIWSDGNQTWQGTIFIWDGAILHTTSGASVVQSKAIAGTSCATPSNARAFAIFADLQQVNIPFGCSASTFRFNGGASFNISAAQDSWNYIDLASTVTLGQATTTFTYSNPAAGDCINWEMMGLYWRQTCTCTIILPIELISFDAGCVEQERQLSWSTATEKNNKVFEIEKSSDGFVWEVIGSINGAGNSTQVKKYSFIDKEADSGIYYYRLKQTDFNGEYSYSKVITSEKCTASELVVQIYPNPSFDLVYVEVQGYQNSPVKILLVDVLGRELILSDNNQGDIASYVYQFPMKEYSEAIYFIKVVVNEKTIIKKIIRQ